MVPMVMNWTVSGGKAMLYLIMTVLVAVIRTMVAVTPEHLHQMDLPDVKELVLDKVVPVVTVSPIDE